MANREHGRVHCARVDAVLPVISCLQKQKSKGERGGMVLGRCDVATSFSIVATMATCVRGACPLAAATAAARCRISSALASAVRGVE